MYRWAGIPLLLFIISFHHRWDAVACSSALGGARRGGRIAAEARGLRGHGGCLRQGVPQAGPAEGGREKTAMMGNVRLSVIEEGSLLQEEGEVTGRTAGVTEGGSTAAAAVEELGAQAAAATASRKPGCIRHSLRGVLRRSPSWALLLVGASASLRRRFLQGSSPSVFPNPRGAIDLWSVAHRRALLPHAEFTLFLSTKGELTAHLPAFSMAATAAEAAAAEGLQVNHTPHRYQLGRGAQQLAAAAAEEE